MSFNQIDEIKNCISRYLSIREHSKSELFEKLYRKKFDQLQIKECISDFEVKGLQSDHRYAEIYVKLKIKAQKGPQLIKSNLIKNGINKSIISSVLLEYTREDWENAAITALKKKTFPDKFDNTDIKIKKQRSFLELRGFDYRIIEKAIEEFWKS